MSRAELAPTIGTQRTALLQIELFNSICIILG